MWELARRNLLRERSRLLISILGVALSVVLMLVLTGLYNSYQTRIGDYYRDTDSDLWVVQSGTANFYHSSSVLPSRARPTIEAIAGVARVRPYVGRQVAVTVDGKDFVTYVAAVPEGDRVEGPVEVIEGSDQPRSGEIVIDDVFANETGLEIGDELRLRGRTFRIAGLTEGGDMIMYQYAWLPIEEALRLQGSAEIVNFYRVDLARGAVAGDVQRSIERAVPSAEAWSTDRVIEENQGLIKDTFLPVISVLLFIGFVVGAAVIGLMTYSAVIEKRREYGILKALGARPRDVFRTLLGQSGIAGLVGYAFGTIAAVALAIWVPGWIPQFAIDIEFRYVVAVFGAAAGMILVSIALPLLRLRRVDPAEVFRA